MLKKKKAYVVAVVGATGAVGEEMIATLEQREFPVEKLKLFATERSAQWAPLAVRSGCVVIDNSSHWRMDPEVPLVVPEVNAQDLERHMGIVANPNCSTIQMVVVLKPIHDVARIRRIVVTTFQSVSGAGKKRWRSLDSRLPTCSVSGRFKRVSIRTR